jgi:CO dehydrogenase/acetyl-CoA synthase beta subunit
LGSPQHESVSYIVISPRSEIQDGRITLIGPDIPQSEGKELNFGQVLLISGSNIPNLEYKEMERALFHLQNLEGFMIRAIPNKLWARVNRQAVQRGFSFETLGKALMLMYRKQFRSIEAMEIVFITTDSPQDFLELRVIGSEVRKKYLKTYSDSLKTRLAELTEKQRADCDNPWSCEECDYNEVCDEIQDIVDKMKAYRARKEASK